MWEAHLTEHEKAVLRNAEEVITGEFRNVMNICNRLDDAPEYIFGVHVVKDSLQYCLRHLRDARLSISDALRDNRCHLEE